jgi:hypothetical protein
MADDIGLGSIVKGAIEGLGKQARDWIDWWRNNKRQQQPMKILDEMLRHPKYRFRETSTLARAIHDTTTGHVVTVALLQHIGARHNLGKKETWTKDDNWEQDDNGTWSLRSRVEPGRI